MFVERARSHDRTFELVRNADAMPTYADDSTGYRSPSSCGARTPVLGLEELTRVSMRRWICLAAVRAMRPSATGRYAPRSNGVTAC